ncbi:MAG: hypothetical protein EXX96DRAFT_555509 [Benjaminiella poitrasii]|nr:MAG: hypothetical protein EXX96DRAFT_555509 [Benjaminiella poitrasii]
MNITEEEEDQYINILNKLKTKSNFISQHIKEWKPVDDDSIQAYYNQQHDQYKIIINSAIRLADIYATLLTIDSRKEWCPWIKDIKILNKPNSNTSVLELTTMLDQEMTFTWTERVIKYKKKERIRYLGTAGSHFLICDFEPTNVVIYYQKPYHTIVSTTLSNLIRFETNCMHIWPSQFDNNTITLNETCLMPNQYEIKYTYLSSSSNESSERRHPPSLTRFMNPSSFLFTSSSSSEHSSPKLKPIMTAGSYQDAPSLPWEMEHPFFMNTSYQHELRIELGRLIPDLTISIENNPQWSDKFAQLCVRLYSKQQQQPDDNSYFLQILHPHKLMQYFKSNDKLLDDDNSNDNDKEPIRVKVIIKRTTVTNTFIVNGKEWPVRTWTRTSSSSTNNSDSSEDEDNSSREEIFKDGMEEHHQSQTETKSLDEQSTSQQNDDETQLSANSIQSAVTADDGEKLEIEQDHASSLMIENTQQPQQPQQPQQQKQQKQQQPIPEKTISSKSSSLPSLPLQNDIVEQYNNKQKPESKLPPNDPAALQKIYPQFINYLTPTDTPTILQHPNKENGYVTIKRLDIPNHPLGGFLTETTWKNCSLWDVKAVLESASARKIWDTNFDSTTLLHPLTPTSSLWHTKMKGTWPIPARDYICFHGHYDMTDTDRIDLLATSCIGDSFQHKSLPPSQVAGYTRATMDLEGWRLARIESTDTVFVQHVLVTQFPTWVINYITSRHLLQSCSSALQSARDDYFAVFGAPPSLESIQRAQLVDIKYDHDRKHWRCEYHHRRDQSTITAAEDQQQPRATTEQAVTSVIRLDNRRWATQYSIVIDPPPSRVWARERAEDPYGTWLTVEHDVAFIIPLRGKVLVLIKPDAAQRFQDTEHVSDHININGVSTAIERQEQPRSAAVAAKEASPATAAPYSENFLKTEQELEESKVNVVQSDEEKLSQALDQMKMSPKNYARATLSFLKSTDEQYGWTVLSDNSKTGIRTSKKAGVKSTDRTLARDDAETGETAFQVFEPYMIYKGTKVIENFSAEEVLAVVSDLGHVRRAWDDTIECPIDVIRTTQDAHCSVIRETIKSIFPFKNREYYAVSCLAQEEPSSLMPATSASTSAMKRTFYIECSIPDFPIIQPKRSRGQFFVSGWILEAIDPYNTMTANHPIPSTRIIHVAALDLGNAVPSYISNLVASNWFPKKIQAVESYLKAKGPPPFVTTEPSSLLSLSGNQLESARQDGADITWLTPPQSTYDTKQHHFNVHHRFRITDRPKQQSTVHTRVPLLQATLDLREYPRGYEIQTHLYSNDLSTTNVTQKMVLTVTEPAFMLLDGQQRHIKHTITMDGLRLVAATEYTFEFSLMPVKEETLTRRLLTVSHVLGDTIPWDGVMMVNGQVIEKDKEVYLNSVDHQDREEEVKTTTHNNPHRVKTVMHDVEATTGLTAMTAQYMGGGVVATALENVSAGVNNIGARMMIPFRVASNSFRTSSPERLKEEEEEGKEEEMTTTVLSSSSTTASSDEETTHEGRQRQKRFTREERNKMNAAMSLHEVRMLRRTRDTMRKGFLLLLICFGLAVVLALLMLQPMLGRTVLDESNQEVRRLIQLPWFGGWDIQVIAIQKTK